MKTKLLKRIPAAAVLCLIAALAITTAMTARAAEKKEAPKSPPPAYMPPPVPGGSAEEIWAERAALRPDLYPPPPSPGYLRPANQQRWYPEEWKDSNWTDPDIIVTNIGWASMPLSEVTRFLRREFKNHFDVLVPDVTLPRDWRSPNPAGPEESIRINDIAVELELRNVTASEFFNAMNLVFETENAPLRWQLILNGSRPTAVLRVLPELLPAVLLPEAPKKERMVFFVGDLIGDEKSGGMTFDQIVQTLMEVCNVDGKTVKLHKEAQLFVITGGTRDDIQFVQSTLSALKQKVDLEQKRKAPPTSGETKTKS